MFRKRGSSRIIFLPNFQNFWQSDLLMKSSGLQLLWIPILSQQAKKFSKLAIKQPPFWCLYYDISSCFFVFEWKGKIIDGVFLRKVSGFFYKHNTVDNWFAMRNMKTVRTAMRTVPYYYLKIPEGFSKVIFHKFLGWLLLKVFQQIRQCSKSATKERVELFQ